MNKKIALFSAAMLLSSTAWAGTTTTGISNASGSALIALNGSVQQPQASVSIAGSTTSGISNASGSAPVVSGGSVQQPQVSVSASGTTTTN